MEDQNLTPVEVEAKKDKGAGKKTQTPATKASKNSKSGKKVTVFTDTSWEDILRADEDGALLVFSTREGMVPTLDEEQLKQLSKVNRDRYYIVKESFEDEESETDQIQRLIEVAERQDFGSARARLAIENKDSRFKYNWLAPHDWQWGQKSGYIVVQNGREKTTAQRSDGKHVITNGRGDIELMLFKAPVEVGEIERKRQRDEYDRQNKVGEQDLKEAAREEGVLPYKENEREEMRTGVKFKPVRQD